MKVLLFLSSHKQLEEIYLYGQFLKRYCPTISTFDFILHINNINIDISKAGNYFQTIPNENKQLIFTSKNKGYTFGHMEACADYFDLFKEYDYVIHTHPDIFITQEEILLKILEIFYSKHYVFIVNNSIKDDNKFMSTDFIIFRPKLLSFNIFKDFEKYYNIYNLNTGGSEHALYDILNKNNISYFFIKRFDNDHWEPRRIDMIGLWHEHNLERITQYLAV